MSATPRSAAEASAFAATRDAFAAAVQGPTNEVPLARGALLIARSERPALDVDAHEARIEAIADEARHRLRATAGDPLPERAAPLHELLFDELGFQGDEERYGSLPTLLLSDVLDNRRGMPITLALLYVEICRRAGLPADVIGIPGHVIARLGDPPDPHGSPPLESNGTLVDAFAGGRLLSTDDCRALVRRIYGGRSAVPPHTLAAITPRQTLQRMLVNLRGRGLEEGDEERAGRATELLLAMFPWDLDGVRDRGLLHERLGRYAEAIADLEHYVRHRPTAPDARAVAEALRTARSHQRERSARP
jgi:regulator of sirC expression with transglutaminase-like and TPR domain